MSEDVLPESYLEHVLAERTILSDGPPPLQDFDEKIRRLGSSTFALCLDPNYLQDQKKLPRPTYEQRIIEQVREIASYRRELRFFRRLYQAMEEAQEEIASVAQQSTLNYYICPACRGDGDREWLTQADDLNTTLRKYANVVQEAANEWIELAMEQSKRDTPRSL